MVGTSLSGGVSDTIVEFLLQNGGNYLEIGCFDGVTLSGIAERVQNSICFGVDPFISDGHLGPALGINNFLENQKNNLYQNISDHQNISFFEMTTENFLKTQDVESMNISVVFIDGAHIFDFVMIDIEAAIKCIGKKSGLIVIDDQHISDVSRATKEFERILSSSESRIETSWRISSWHTTANCYKISSS